MMGRSQRSSTASSARSARWRNKRATRCFPVIGALLLLLLASARTHASESQTFEPAPLKSDRAQQEWLRSRARRTQEKYRLRVALPATVLTARPADASSDGPRQGFHFLELPEQVSSWGRMLLLAMLLGGAGWLAWRRLFSAAGQSGLDSGWPGGSTRPGLDSAGIETPAEEQAFAQFLVTFRAGPSGSPQPATLPGQTAAPEAPAGVSSEPRGPDARQRFYSGARDRLAEMRNVLQTIQRESKEAAQRKLLGDLRARLRALIQSASLPELLPVWQLATAIEGLAGQLGNPNRPLASNSLRTLAGGLDLLAEFCEQGRVPVGWSERPLRILAVDDDLISRHAVALALKKAFNQPDLAPNGEAAFAQASLIGYDVIFLDVLMPGMDGFELCSKIRQTSVNRVTPIVFVTSQTDFEARAKSSLSGGNDFLTKPFLTFELTVKALVLAARCRLARQNLETPPLPALCPA